MLLAVVGGLEQQWQTSVHPLAHIEVELLQQGALHGVRLGGLQYQEGTLGAVRVLFGVEGEHSEEESAFGGHVHGCVERVQALVEFVQGHAEDAGGDVVDVEGVHLRVEQVPGAVGAVHHDLQVRVSGKHSGQRPEQGQRQVGADDGAVARGAGCAGLVQGEGHARTPSVTSVGRMCGSASTRAVKSRTTLCGRSADSRHSPAMVLAPAAGS